MLLEILAPGLGETLAQVAVVDHTAYGIGKCHVVARANKECRAAVLEIFGLAAIVGRHLTFAQL